MFRRLERKYRNYITSDPQVSYDIGSLDGTDSISLSKIFHTKLLAFEPTPNSYKIVAKNLEMVNGSAFQFMLADYCGSSEFFVNDPVKTITTWADGNQGANSALKNNKNYPIETYFQNSIKVQVRAIKCLIENGFPNPNFIWMDCQGSELSVLKGMGSYLDEVSFIYCELSLFQLYENQPYALEVIEYLNLFGFLWVGNLTFGSFQFDACFVKPKKIS